MSEPVKKKISLALVGRILKYSKPYKGLFFGGLILTVVLAGMAIIRPLLISRALNEDVVNLQSLESLTHTALIIMGVLLLEATLQVVNVKLTSLLGQNIVKDLRNQVYSHLLKLKNTYFDNTPVGTLVTRAISDIESLNEVFAQGFIVIAGDLVMLLIFMVAMFTRNWLLALLALSSIPLLFFATALFKRGVKKTFTLVRNAVSDLNTFTQEHITGMKLVQLFNRESIEYQKFNAINDQHRVANIKSIFYYSVFFPVVEILSSFSIALVIWFSGLKGNSWHINLGDLTFFIMMINMLFRPIRMLADRLNTLQMGFVSAERVFAVLDTQEFIPDQGTIKFEKVKHSIEFKSVWFAYKEKQYVMKDVSLKIQAGSTVALVGSTGAGKSTVINLLSRFYEIGKGSICIDDIPIESYTLESLRRNTGVVLQDVHLFNDTVYNNITLHNPDITREMVRKATEETGLTEFVDNLPGGYDYIVTERGQGLSAGQRQLIAFIRAYVYQPAIFILDEATATIDTRTEIMLQKAVEKIAIGRTSIIIAHRLSTIKHAHTIFVFDKGEVVEQGSMEQLLSTDSRFKKLYELQTEVV